MISIPSAAAALAASFRIVPPYLLRRAFRVRSLDPIMYPKHNSDSRNKGIGPLVLNWRNLEARLCTGLARQRPDSTGSVATSRSSEVARPRRWRSSARLRAQANSCRAFCLYDSGSALGAASSRWLVTVPENWPGHLSGASSRSTRAGSRKAQTLLRNSAFFASNSSAVTTPASRSLPSFSSDSKTSPSSDTRQPYFVTCRWSHVPGDRRIGQITAC